MPVKVKICGVRTPSIVEAAAEAGADYVGLVFFLKSPRNVTPEEACVLAQAAHGRLKTVALMVDPDDGLIDRVLGTVNPDLLQLHGNETPQRVAEIKAHAGRPVIKAIAVSDAADVANAAAFADSADIVLFDAKADPDAELPGGNGVPFDWQALRGLRAGRPFALSGGLTPDTVAQAVRLTGASIVDVSSGVESAPGKKDANLVRRFVRAAKSAASSPEAKAS